MQAYHICGKISGLSKIGRVSLDMISATVGALIKRRAACGAPRLKYAVIHLHATRDAAASATPGMCRCLRCYLANRCALLGKELPCAGSQAEATGEMMMDCVAWRRTTLPIPDSARTLLYAAACRFSLRSSALSQRSSISFCRCFLTMLNQYVPADEMPDTVGSSRRVGDRAMRVRLVEIAAARYLRFC